MIPAFADINFPSPKHAFQNNVSIPFNVSKSTEVSYPDNVMFAYIYINLYTQQNENDEFWYMLQLPFREFRLFINNTFVATVQPYPNIQTGGGDLFLNETINTTATTSVYTTSPFPHLISETKTYTSSYYQVNSIDIEYVVQSPSSIAIGFNVTQINVVKTLISTVIRTDQCYQAGYGPNYTSEEVNGNGLFDAVINSGKTITSITYNHAMAHKIVLIIDLLSLSFSRGAYYSAYYLDQNVINNSLINRNEVLSYSETLSYN
ncbi:MAG: hypothetical protein QXU18_14755 [Thermoplasmatales archaeon]